MNVGDWLEDNPRARPLLMFGLFAVVLLMVGILLGLSKKKKDPLVSEMMTNTVIAHVPDPAKSSVPTGGGEEQVGQPPQRPRVAWIADKDVPGRKEPGLNLPVLHKYQQWEEVTWIREESFWDQVRGSDGQELWVQGKFVQFVKPANLDKPSEAEMTVMSFYQAVARKDYAAAYAYLSPAWKAQLDFDHFVEGYSRTLSLRTELSRVVPLGKERFQVDVSMMADELGHEVPYTGSYVVQKTEDRWDMTEGSLNRQSQPERRQPGSDPVRIPAGSPVAPAPTPEAYVTATPMANSTAPQANPTAGPRATPTAPEPQPTGF